jgi:hypothetical protein
MVVLANMAHYVIKSTPSPTGTATEVRQTLVMLECYASWVGSYLPTFRYILSFTSLGSSCLKRMQGRGGYFYIGDGVGCEWSSIKINDSVRLL